MGVSVNVVREEHTSDIHSAVDESRMSDGFLFRFQSDF